jgi:hypothetical protein
MEQRENNDLKPMREQITYANVLFIGAWSGIFLMIITYILYLSGVISPHVDVDLVIRSWGKGVDEYMAVTGSPHGWAWLAMLGKGDFLNFVGVVLLAVLTIICYFFLIAGFKRRRDWTFLVIAILEVLVLAFAASGILGSGGH